MSDEPLLTLRQVADELHLPESTVRYYRDAFLDHIPSIGTGRRRRYPPPAVAVLRSVAEGYASGRSREAILGTLEGATPHAGSEAAERPHAVPRPPAGVSNLELLAAIVDGEREQRDALWQMAKEIVRLTDVLEGQEKVLTEIADHAGVQPSLLAAPQTRALAEGRSEGAPRAAPPFTPAPAPFPEPVQAAPPPPPPAEASTAWTPAPVPPPPPLQPPGPVSRVEPPAAAPPASEMERLRVELESERQLVERLREAKLKLEHRASNAEAELEERRSRKRTSMLGRLLKPGEE